jgi:hypothetical protein
MVLDPMDGGATELPCGVSTGGQANWGLRGSKIEAVGDFNPNNHSNPIVVPPDFNDLLTVH